MFILIFACLVSSIFIFSFGALFYSLFFRHLENNAEVENIGVFGVIFLSFITLLINFFIPINKLVGTILTLFSILYFLLFYFKSLKKKEIIFFILASSFISFFLVVFSNINRPDAGLYHLPYVGILHDNKVIFGLSNLHFRYGHISLLQYLSASHYNYFLKLEFINIAMSTTASFFFYFLFKNYYRSIKKKDGFLFFFIFLLLVFSLYAFNRYSNYGNDAISHFYFFILSILFLKIENLRKIKNHEFFQISFISIFLFALKPFMIFLILFPLIIFIINKKKLKFVFDKNTLICLVFIFSWIIKNIITSGCAIYPVTATCFSNLHYFDKDKTEEVALMGELWAKDIPNNKKYKSFEEFNTKFNWVNVWKDNHFKVIIKKLLPYLIFLFLLLIMLLIDKIFINKFEKNTNYKSKFFILSIFSIFLTVIWFVKFPIYRYGISFIILSINSIFIYAVFKIFNIQNVLKFYKFFYVVLSIGIFLFFAKNSNRIYKNFAKEYNSYPWPRIFTLNNSNTNKPIDLIPIKEGKEVIYYFSGGNECMYTKNICTNYLIKDISRKENFGYYYYKKN